jgi:hydrogenase maturation protease
VITNSPNTPPRRVLVVGYGSPLRGDDAVGPLIADRLMDELPAERVQVRSRHILTPDLVEDVCQASLAIFIDAAVEGPLGEVRCRRITAGPQVTMSMAHFLDPSQLLAWAKQLYGHEPEAYLISIRGANFDFAHFELTPEVAAASETAMAQVRELIDRHCGPSSAQCDE